MEKETELSKDKKTSFHPFLEKAISILSQKQAGEILIYDMRQLSQLFDYAVIASGYSSTQLDVIRRALERGLRTDGLRAYGVEGKPESGWILLDFMDFVVHVFTPEKREYYRLDQLWGDLPCEEMNENDEMPEKEAKIKTR